MIETYIRMYELELVSERGRRKVYEAGLDVLICPYIYLS